MRWAGREVADIAVFYLIAKGRGDHEQESARLQAGISPLLAVTILRLLSLLQVRKLTASGALPCDGLGAKNDDIF